jgi:DNA-binding Lrp family transcriptional regulator
MFPKKSEVERKALKLILNTGKEGLFQTELSKLLDINNREASRIAKKLEEKGKVRREKVLNNRRWTYKIFSMEEYVSINSIEGCPCLVCPEMDRCFRGGRKDPTTCLDLTAWIDPRIEPVPINDY